MRKGTKRYVTLLTAVILSVPAFAQDADNQLLLRHFHSISSEEIADWMTELCDTKYNGRLAGTPEYLEAARWVAGNLAEWGVKPAGDNGTYLQAFPNPYTLVFPDCYAYLHIPGEGTVYQKYYHYYDEFIPGSTSGSGTPTQLM